MASSTLKTQFSPYIAQLGMPSKGMLSAFGDAVDEYETDKRKDILFGIQEKKENAILDKTNFDLEQARLRAPFEAKTSMNQANKTALDLEHETLNKTSGAWQNSIDESKQKLEQSKYKTTTDRIESENKLNTITADINYKNALTSSSTATANASKFKQEDADLAGFLYSKISAYDKDGNGVLDANERTQYESLISSGGITIMGRDGKSRKSTEADARLFGSVVDEYEKSKSDLAFKASQTEKNNNVNLGIDNSTKAITAARDYGTKLATKHGLKSDSDLATLDTTKLEDGDKAELQSWADQYVKASGKKDIIQKEIAPIVQQQGMLKEVAYYVGESIKKGNDVNFATTAINKLGGYLGDEVTFDKELAAKNSLFQSVLNTQLKIQSGTAVTESEYNRFLKETSTLYESNPKMVTALQTMAFKQMEQLKGLKAAYAYDPVFNVRYGSIYKGAEDTLKAFEKIGAVDKEQTKPQFKGFNGNNQAPRSQVDLNNNKYF